MGSRDIERKSVTLSDVAREANVAPMTVSRYLNNHPNISERTAQKVSAAIKKLGYAPNVAARMLMGQPSNTIGLIVPNLADPFFAEVAHNVQQVAWERSLLVWVAASNSNQNAEFALVRQMKQHHVDGILVIPSPGPAAFPNLGKTPVVSLDRPVVGGEISSVVVENRAGARQAVSHLVEHGYRRIVCISSDPREIYTSAERMAGYEESMQANGLRSETIPSQDTLEQVHSTIEGLLQRRNPPEAIFTTNNVTTVHVVEALQQLRVKVPKEVALIGFDDFELARILRPQLTVVRQPAAELGRQAARLLFDHLGDPQKSTTVTISLPVKLVQRASCGCGPAA